MTDNPTPEPVTGTSSSGEQHPSDIASEFQQLGKNLISMLQSAWESEERKKLQQEIETGLKELGATLNQATNDFKDSSTGQRLKADVEEFHARVRSGEIEGKVREELVSVLRTVNAELVKAGPPKTSPPPAAGSEGASGEQ